MNPHNFEVVEGGPLRNWRQILLESSFAAQILERLHSEARTYGHEAVQACRTEIEMYRSFNDPAMIERIVNHCAQHAVLMNELRHREFVFAEDDFEFVRENATLRAREGMPLEVLLHAYRVGNRVMWDLLWQAMIAVEPPQSEVNALTAALATYTMDYTNRASSAVAHAYGDAQRLAEALASQQRRAWLEQLLAGNVDAATHAELKPYGLDEHNSCLVVSAHLNDTSGQSNKALLLLQVPERLREICQASSKPVLADVWEQRIVAVLPTAIGGDSALLARLLKDQDWLLQIGLTIGIGPVVPGIQAVPASDRDAQYACVHATSEHPVMRFDDVSLFEHLITTAHDSIHRIRPPWTQALVEEDERLQGALLETLQVYLQSRMSAKATASTLDVHVNTIYHRLHRIEDISTRRTSSVVDVLDLIVALRLSAQRI